MGPSSPPAAPYPPPAMFYPPVVVVERSPPPPRPRGIPNRGLFLIGAGGQFFVAGAAVGLGIALLMNYMTEALTSPLHFIMGLLLSVAFFIGLVGFYGLWRNYGSALGAVTFGFGLAAAIVYLIAVVLAFLLRTQECYFECYSYLPAWAMILYFVAFIFLGVTFILEGVSYIVSRNHLGTAGGAVGAGVVSIIGGAFLCSVVLAVYGGLFVVTAASIVGGIVFALARVPFVAASRPPWPASPMDPGPQIRVR